MVIIIYHNIKNNSLKNKFPQNKIKLSPLFQIETLLLDPTFLTAPSPVYFVTSSKTICSAINIIPRRELESERVDIWYASFHVIIFEKAWIVLGLINLPSRSKAPTIPDTFRTIDQHGTPPQKIQNKNSIFRGGSPRHFRLRVAPLQMVSQTQGHFHLHNMPTLISHALPHPWRRCGG